MKKKLLSLLLALAMCLSLCVPAFAIVPPEDAYTPETDSLAGYDQYVIIMNGANVIAANTAIQTNGAVTKDVSYGASLSNAINYVESLNLAGAGHAHIEQACLEELQNYEDAGVELEYYAVLVPNGTTATETTYGNYSGRTYYYTLTSVSAFTLSFEGQELGADFLGKWVEGTFHLILSLANQVYSIGYSLFGSIGDNVNYHTGSFFHYFLQLYNVKTRTIYAYDGNTKQNVIIDQYGASNLTSTFVPLGPDLPEQSHNWEARTSSTMYYNNKTRNLQRAHVNFAHNSTEYWYLVNETITEVWA